MTTKAKRTGSSTSKGFFAFLALIIVTILSLAWTHVSDQAEIKRLETENARLLDEQGTQNTVYATGSYFTFGIYEDTLVTMSPEMEANWMAVLTSARPFTVQVEYWNGQSEAFISDEDRSGTHRIEIHDVNGWVLIDKTEHSALSFVMIAADPTESNLLSLGMSAFPR